MNNPGYITIKKHADCMHRVMNHTSKCSNVHGHAYLYELTFKFTQLADLGYAMDFSELKRVGVQWIEDKLDHGAILNPHDGILIDACTALNSKLWLMSLNGKGEYCNPSVENIVKEMFLAQDVLWEKRPEVSIHAIRVYETPNCFTDCTIDTISTRERDHFYNMNYDLIESYAKEKSVVIYDDRCIK